MAKSGSLTTRNITSETIQNCNLHKINNYSDCGYIEINNAVSKEGKLENAAFHFTS